MKYKFKVTENFMFGEDIFSLKFITLKKIKITYF